MEQNLPGALKKHPKCGRYLLSLEFKTSQSFPKEYASRWLSRLDWPKYDIVIHYIWTASEDLYRINDIENAKKLWKYLAQEIPPTFKEVNYAKKRLENNKTEVEQLWNQ